MEVEALELANLEASLTIVIPTYNRPNNVLRLCTFYKFTNYQILILDGSALKNQQIGVKKNIKYIHMPNSTLQERLAYSSDLIQTKFVAICADDDFLIPKGLLHSIKYLTRNIDFAAAQGMYIRFATTPFFSWRPDYIHWKDVKIESDDPMERVLKSKTSCQFLYSTMRKEVYVATTSVLKGIQSGSLTMNELVFNYIVPFYGKYKTLPIIYGARIEHSKSSVNLYFDLWIEKNEESSKYFKRQVRKVYSTKLSDDQSRELENILTDHFSVSSRANRIQSSNTLEKVNSKFRNYKSIHWLRPIRSLQRLNWFFYQFNSILTLISEIRKLKKFLLSYSVFDTPQL
jgi:glycosyltransferase domain-containing protein